MSLTLRSDILFTDVMKSRRLYRRFITSYDFMPHARDVGLAFGTIGRVLLGPLQVHFRVAVDRIGYECGAVSAGNARIGLYKEGATIDIPNGGALLIDSGSQAQPGVHTVGVYTIPELILEPGMYYAAIEGSDVTGTFWSSLDSAGYMSFYYDLGAFLALSDPCPATAWWSSIPFVFLRVSRVLV